MIVSSHVQRTLAFVISVFFISLTACTKKDNISSSAKPQNSIAVAEITNANNFSLAQEPLYFSFYDLGLVDGDQRINQLTITADGQPLPTEPIDKNGDGIQDGLFVLSDFKSAQTRKFIISDSALGAKTNELVKRSIANAEPQVEVDTKNLLTSNATHSGGLGFWNGKKFEPAPVTENNQLVEANHGHLFSAYTLKYSNWVINNERFDVNAHVEINKSSPLALVTLNASKKFPGFAIALAKTPETILLEGDTNITRSAWTYVATLQRSADDKVTAANAIIFHRGDRKQQTEGEQAYVSVMNSNGGELEYYFIDSRSKQIENIHNKAEFQAYLDEQTQRLTKAPRIRFESELSKQAKMNLTADDALNWAKRLADSELDRKTLNYYFGGWDEYRKRPARFEYDVVGMQIDALQQIDAISPNEKYKSALEKITGSYIQDDGSIATYEPDLFSIDLIKPGQMVIQLEQRTHQEKYRKAADYLRGRLKLHPRTSEGAFWHRSTYPNQLWLDGVYMGIPFLAQYAAAYETGEAQHKSFAEAVHEFEIARNHLRSPDTGLYYHAWDESKLAEWADKQTGRAPQYWSRGMGWYAMALVDVLDFIPESETELRKSLLDITNEFAPDILRYQDAETSTWWQITDHPNDVGNYRESSASAMFSYFLLKAVNKGYVPASYGDAAFKTYRGLVNEFITLHADGKISMNDQCLVAGLGFGRDGSYNYYLTEAIVSNDPKGNSPFIYASLEAYKYLKSTAHHIGK
jgi:rhamnogalacturonyl hydrolase YesR